MAGMAVLLRLTAVSVLSFLTRRNGVLIQWLLPVHPQGRAWLSTGGPDLRRKQHPWTS